MLTQKEAMTMFRETVYKDLGSYFSSMKKDIYDCWQVFIEILLEDDLITDKQASRWFNPID